METRSVWLSARSHVTLALVLAASSFALTLHLKAPEEKVEQCCQLCALKS